MTQHAVISFTELKLVKELGFDDLVDKFLKEKRSKMEKYQISIGSNCYSSHPMSFELKCSFHLSSKTS